MKNPAAKTATGLLTLLLALPLQPGSRTGSEDKILARLNTSRGVIVLELDFKKTPLTVANFIGLAEGTIENGVFPVGRPFFNGTKFHRVVPGHVIQAGRPEGSAAEGPNYEIPNEIHPGLGHGRAGVLGMANSGPHTNGSQFYVTLADRSYLDGDYTVFGRVVEGLDVVNAVVQGDAIVSVDILRSGPQAAAFKTDTKSFVALLETARRRVLEAAAAKEKSEKAVIAANWPEAVLTPSGLRYQVLEAGGKVGPEKGDRLKVIYSGQTFAGRKFFSTADEGRPSSSPPAEPFLYRPGHTSLTPALESALATMKRGEKRLVIAPAPLAYGTRGYYGREQPGGKRFVISPGTTLVYEVELLDALKPDYALTPVPFARVTLTDRFWAPRLETNRRVTIPYALRQCEETGRIRNFETAAALLAGSAVERKFHTRYPFDDSDVFKIIEGASASLESHPDPALEKRIDELISVIAAAQEPDGYLYTARTIFRQNPSVLWVDSPERWSDLRRGHELYNAGHLYEAAAAHFRATGKRGLLNVALKNADLVASVFGPGKRPGVPGHPEIEIGLVKLYGLTGNRSYLELARHFLNERGRFEGRESFGEYAQDHMPLNDQTDPVGHAVRAGYLYAAATDIAALTNAGPAAQRALETLWRNVVSKKMYVTGGVGAAGAIEGFGPDYDLPNATAYCETCASIAMALWSRRLFLLNGESDSLDVLERLLYNGILPGVSLDGDRFFYSNPLASFGRHQRSPWFSCACCPSNLSRFLPAVPGFLYALGEGILYVNLFADSRASLTLKNGRDIKIVQRTDYPWNGRVEILVDPQVALPFTIAVRIPGWARNRPFPGDLYAFADGLEPAASLKVNGRAVPVAADRGWVLVNRTWAKGDAIELELPMPVRRIRAHDRVRDNAGRVALERGPIVYCAEGVDHEGRVSHLAIPDDAALEPQRRDDLLGGIVVLNGQALSVRRGRDGATILESPQAFTAVPYFSWAHRGRGEMAVWLPRKAEGARPLPRPTPASDAEPSVSGGRDARALNDLYDPLSSSDTTYPFVHWKPNKGTREWVQYDFPSPVRISGVEVYWVDEAAGSGDCRVPESWRVLYRDGGTWRGVERASSAAVEPDRYNIMAFSPVSTAALRIEIRCRKNFSAGIHEWRIR
ncbi:MAG: glycoside hydrolase family 127 protein [Candidatus Aminicenantes bacterium]|nr:glycoside hydrolase family 127 protein [Candidatus Aminicenantes bacterium]